MADKTLHVRIISPQALLLDTEASSVSSKNADGAFDILAEHANFITMVENQPIIIKPARNASGSVAGGPLTFTYALAIIMASSDKVNIYTYIQPNLEKK